MKKSLILLFFPVFFTSCPSEDLSSEEYLFIDLKNGSNQTIDVEFSFSSNKNARMSNRLKHVAPDSCARLQGIGIDEKVSDKPYVYLRERIHDKSLLIFNENGDTLSNWTDSSYVFYEQYWMVEHKDNKTICTLQLTDEILECK